MSLPTSDFSSCFRLRPLTEEQAFDKMIRNSEKAILEHRNKSDDSDAYVTLENVTFPSLYNPMPKHSLNVKGIWSAFDIGSRPSMEDIHFHKWMDDKTLIAGILDGHNGAKVAIKAASLFQEMFPESLQALNGHAHQAFESTAGRIEAKIREDSSLDSSGATAVFCLFDLSKHRLITSTHGDCEATIYKKVNDRILSHPTSVLRDWGHPKERDRAEFHNRSPIFFACYPTHATTKMVRGWDATTNGQDMYLKRKDTEGYPTNSWTNVSRAFGKKDYLACICKPKITVNNLNSRTTVILASDGLKVLPKASINSKIRRLSGQDLADDLVNIPYKKKDNTTVMIVEID